MTHHSPIKTADPKIKWTMILMIFHLANSFAQKPNNPFEKPDPYTAVAATTISPQGILGERNISVTFQKQSPKSLSPLDRVPVVPNLAYLYYADTKSPIEQAIINPKQAINNNVFVVSETTKSGNSFSTIFPHSEKTFQTKTRKVLNIRGDQVVYFRWAFVIGTELHLSRLDSFIMPRPLNIAILGDSYGSGEGAPKPSPGPKWLKSERHQSQHGGQYAAVEQFAAENPSIAIEYKPFYLSTSGATSKHLMDVSKDTRRVPNTEKSSQIDPVHFPCGEGRLIPPQLQELHNLLRPGGKYQGKIDVVLMSIGGNDASFSTCIEDAIFTVDLTNKISYYTNSIHELIPLAYDDLKLNFEDLCVKYVFSSEYPDPTSSERGMTCGLPSDVTGFIFSGFLEVFARVLELNNEAFCYLNYYTNPWNLLPFDDGPDCDINYLNDYRHIDYVRNWLKCTVGGGNEAAIFKILAEVCLDFMEAKKEISEISKTRKIGLVDKVNIWSRYNLVPAGCFTRTPTDPLVNKSNLFTTMMATQQEISLAKTGFLIPLNKQIEETIRKFQNQGFTNWHYVGGPMVASSRNGICVCETRNAYFNSLSASLLNQNDPMGWFHMNVSGQQKAYKPFILDKLREVITRDERKQMFEDQDCVPTVPRGRSNKTSEMEELLKNRESLIDDSLLKEEADNWNELCKLFPTLCQPLTKVQRQQIINDYAAAMEKNLFPKYKTCREKCFDNRSSPCDCNPTK